MSTEKDKKKIKKVLDIWDNPIYIMFILIYKNFNITLKLTCGVAISVMYPQVALTKGKMDTKELKRIADILQEILDLVKKDMNPRTQKEPKV